MSLGIYSPEIEEEEHYTEPYSDAIGEKFSQNVMNGISIKEEVQRVSLKLLFNQYLQMKPEGYLMALRKYIKT